MNTQRTTSFLHFITKTRQKPDGYEGGEAVPRDKFITEMSGRLANSLVIVSLSQEPPHSKKMCIMRTSSRTIHAHVDGHVHVHMKTNLPTRPQNQFCTLSFHCRPSVFCVADTRRIVHRDVFFNCCCWCWEQRFHTVSGYCSLKKRGSVV